MIILLDLTMNTHNSNTQRSKGRSLPPCANQMSTDPQSISLIRSKDRFRIER
jgi:hypothetical protein